MIRQQFRQILIPLTMGGLIYIFLRDDGLLMFEWLDVLGLNDTIGEIRTLTLPYKQAILTWVIYSLPNALWTYSLTITMVFNWNKTFNKSSAFWILIGPTLSILSEIAQYFGLLLGTFDIIDLILCFTASILALTHIKNIDIKTIYYEKRNTYTY